MRTQEVLTKTLRAYFGPGSRLLWPGFSAFLAGYHGSATTALLASRFRSLLSRFDAVPTPAAAVRAPPVYVAPEAAFLRSARRA